jgi:hypothetical protein
MHVYQFSECKILIEYIDQGMINVRTVCVYLVLLFKGWKVGGRYPYS